MTERTFKDYLDESLDLETPVGKIFGTPYETYECLNFYSDLKTKKTYGYFSTCDQDMAADWKTLDLSKSWQIEGLVELIEGVNATRQYLSINY